MCFFWARLRSVHHWTCVRLPIQSSISISLLTASDIVHQASLWETGHSHVGHSWRPIPRGGVAGRIYSHSYLAHLIEPTVRKQVRDRPLWLYNSSIPAKTIPKGVACWFSFFSGVPYITPWKKTHFSGERRSQRRPSLRRKQKKDARARGAFGNGEHRGVLPGGALLQVCPARTSAAQADPGHSGPCQSFGHPYPPAGLG